MRIAVAALILAFGAASIARGEEPPRAKTSTIGISKDEVELARYLEMLEEMELLENWDFLELLSVLEDEE